MKAVAGGRRQTRIVAIGPAGPHWGRGTLKARVRPRAFLLKREGIFYIGVFVPREGGRTFKIIEGGPALRAALEALGAPEQALPAAEAAGAYSWALAAREARRALKALRALAEAGALAPA